MRPSVKKLLLFGSTAPYSGALLALDFVGSRTNGQPYYMLNGATYPRVNNIPGWTYTGGTAAGTGSYAARADGSLQFFPSYTNLLLRSQALGTSPWSVFNTASTNPTVTNNAALAPDGTMTATQIDFPAVSIGQISAVRQGVGSLGNPSTLAPSIYLRASAPVVMEMRQGNGAGAGYQAISVTTSWQRFEATPGSNASTTFNFDILVGDNRSSSAVTVYAWGAQLELGSTASTYIPTTTAAVTVATPRITDAGYWAEEARTNLLLRSQEFDNAAWTKTGATISADAITAPDGTTTADKLSEDTSLGAHRFLASQSKAASATTYTFSAYFKAAERSQMRLAFDDGGSNGASAIFDASNGTISTAAAISGDFTSPSATISSLGGGWYRATLTATSNTGTTIRYVIGAALSGSFSYQGVSGSGIYIWQADLQAGSFATSPVPTTSVAVTRAADVGYVSGLVVPSAWTMVESHQAINIASPTYNAAAEISDGTTNNRVFIRQTAVTTLTANDVVAGAGGTGFGVTVPTSGVINSAASTRGTDLVFSAVGSAVGTGASSLPTNTLLTRLTAGNRFDGNGAMNAPIRRIVIYPRAFGNSELQAITTAGAY